MSTNAQLDTNDANDVLIAKSTYTFDDYNTTPMEDYGGGYRSKVREVGENYLKSL